MPLPNTSAHVFGRSGAVAASAFDVHRAELLMIQDDTDALANDIISAATQAAQQQTTDEETDSDDSAEADDSERDNDDAGERGSDRAVCASSSRRSKLPLRVVTFLRAFFLARLPFPFPSESEKAALMSAAKMTHKQIADWMTNNRKRYWRTYQRKLRAARCGLMRKRQECTCGKDGAALHDWKLMWE